MIDRSSVHAGEVCEGRVGVTVEARTAVVGYLVALEAQTDDALQPLHQAHRVVRPALVGVQTTSATVAGPRRSSRVPPGATDLANPPCPLVNETPQTVPIGGRHACANVREEARRRNEVNEEAISAILPVLARELNERFARPAREGHRIDLRRNIPAPRRAVPPGAYRLCLFLLGEGDLEVPLFTHGKTLRIGTGAALGMLVRLDQLGAPGQGRL